MNTDITLKVPAQGPSGTGSLLRAAAATPRLYVYLACTLLTVVVGFVLGKDTRWDTLDYHFYAGFTALHDRFGRDYFAAGTQSYFNPYVYVPFYLLVRSGMPAVVIATVLAVAQSCILWLTYEIGIAVAPAERKGVRIGIGAFAAALTLANPILINQVGSSYIDCLTGEVVLVGWLLLIAAMRDPGIRRILIAGLLLGAVSALKLTNAVHAIAAVVLLAFIPSTWRSRLRYASAFGVALAVGFAVVAAPWALRLYQHFGNPFFPLFNNLFRSPQFTFAPLRDHRFVPDSLLDALWRPIASVLPLKNVHDEFSAPDIRYATLYLLAAALLIRWVYRRLSGRIALAAPSGDVGPGRALVALACAFLADWMMWLTASGNGRYFIAMASVAAILVACLAFLLWSARPKACAYFLAAILAVQVFQLCAGATYRTHVSWDRAPWFEVLMPRQLATTPQLYIAFGLESNSFIVPYLPRDAAFVDLEGDYVIGTSGASGAHVASLIRRYSPNLRVIALTGHFRNTELPGVAHIDDTLSHFGLRVDQGECAVIVVRDMDTNRLSVLPQTLPVNLPQLQGKPLQIAVSPDFHLVTCKAVADSSSHAKLDAGEREANLVFDRLESACPALFQPKGPVTKDYGDARKGYYWVRSYGNTGLDAVIIDGVVRFVDPLRGGWPTNLGREQQWQRAPLRLVCGRAHDRYYARVLSPKR